jgi:two-component sensor histidine kinase
VTPARPSPHERAPATANRRRGAQNRQHERRELDHRLANSLQLAADFLIFEHNRVGDPNARAALIETAERLSAVGQMHRFLAARHEPGGIDLEPFLKELGALIADSTGLGCTVDAEPVVVDAEVAQQLGIAVNELAMNAAKHAYPWGDRGPLDIICRRDAGMLALTVADDGHGLGHGFAAQNSSGLGMSILQAIARQLRGTLQATNDHGARFTLTIPLGAPTASGPRTFAGERG